MQLLYLFLLLLSVNAIDPPYVVVFKYGTPKSVFDNIVKDYQIQVKLQYKYVFMGFAADLNDTVVSALKGNQNITIVERDYSTEMYGQSNLVPLMKADETPTVNNMRFYYYRPIRTDTKVAVKRKISITQNVYSWGLARLCSTSIPSSFETYTYPENAGSGIDVYIVDTGINITLPELEGRAICGKNFWSANYTTDCMDDHGHGTHVAGIVGSKSFGVAKRASLIAVKVAGPDGYGMTSQLIAGIDWVVYEKKRTRRNSVMNVSLGKNIFDFKGVQLLVSLP